MNGWTETRVWWIDHKLVVAPTIEDAISLFKTYMGEDYRDEPHEIQGVSTMSGFPSYDAIIKEEEK